MTRGVSLVGPDTMSSAACSPQSQHVFHASAESLKNKRIFHIYPLAPFAGEKCDLGLGAKETDLVQLADYF